jgi:hypothetical protein
LATLLSEDETRTGAVDPGGVEIQAGSVFIEHFLRPGVIHDRVQKAFVIAVIVTVSLTGQTTRPPSALTLEERIALRTNPALARERVQRSRTLETNAARADVRSIDAFDGQTHPELFLPTEVFRSLITSSTLGPPRTSQLFRKGLMAEVRRHGLPPDFWERLQSLSAIYIADSWAERDIGHSLQKVSGPARRRSEAALALKQVDVCRSRADALSAARKEFGRERFDRFLYEAIAVHKFHSETRLPDPQMLRHVEAGCR